MSDVSCCCTTVHIMTDEDQLSYNRNICLFSSERSDVWCTGSASLHKKTRTEYSLDAESVKSLSDEIR